MTKANPLPELQPSDVLLYWTPCWLDVLISVKTYSDVAHVEVYEGNGMSSAARKEGVNLYTFRSEGLRYVYRPIEVPDNESARQWFRDQAQGYGYWYLGLLGFDWPKNHPVKLVASDGWHKKFCSQYGTQRLRAARCQPFHPEYPAEKVPPGLFKSSANLRCIWRL